jgi:hypothetical protein
MAPRPSWRGYLKLSLVTCPVAMLPATSEAEKVRLHTLNRATGNRVHARYVDAETGKPVDDEDQVKGYEREDGEYVMLEDEELDAVALESTRTIDIDCVRHEVMRLVVPDPADRIGWHETTRWARRPSRSSASHVQIEHACDLARRALSPGTGRAAGTTR